MNIVANTPYKCINLHMSSHVLMLEIGLEMFFVLLLSNVLILVDEIHLFRCFNNLGVKFQLGHLSVGHAPSEAG